MKAVILAGGFGTRLSEYTQVIPKPMVNIGPYPIIHHIMNLYSKYNVKDFIIALGYKADIVKNYFYSLSILNNDFTINPNKSKITFHNNDAPDWNITLVDTGINTMTGGRLLRVSEHIKTERFFCTYGDGLSNINIKTLLENHINSGCLATVTAVRPQARFGELIIGNDNKVKSFKEKPQLNTGYINGGFFIFEPEVLSFIKNDDTVLEKEPLEKLANKSELNAFAHDGFWQCMDNKRDHEFLEKIYSSGEIPWV
tara:strand:+ start:372 stop:1136 length:765 start_codon:yes stop_codon:yes gene_type:complete